MAGDWIPIERATLEKPEVLEIAEVLGLDPDTVIGKLLRVWFWFDEQTENGNAVGVTSVTLLKRICNMTGVQGFGEAMQKVGWLNGTAMPNFERHTSESAKKRALTRKRVKRFRNADGVTSALPEKRTEEKKIKPSPSVPKGTSVPELVLVEVVTPTNQTLLDSETGGAKSAMTWLAYSQAYAERYGAEPVRNATVNGQLANFVKRLGDKEAPAVAAFYVGSNRQVYVGSRHAVSLMLRDAEGLRTEWATGRRMTDTAARQADKLGSNFQNAEELKRELATRKPD